MRIFSTFSGIGGFEIGIERAALSFRHGATENTESATSKQGVEPTTESVRNDRHISDAEFRRNARQVSCVGYSEIDKYAISVYERNFPNVRNFGDITKINAKELPDFDCLVGGFPCQAFSIAGKRRGFEDTRGTLFFDLARILREKQPRYFVFENVKGLLSHDQGNTFRTIIAATDELGYDVQWQVLNSKNHGVPQNRERVYIVGHLRGTPRPQVFPITGGGEQIATVAGYISEEAWPGRHEQIRRVYETDGAMPTIPTGQGGGVMTKIVSYNRNDGIGKELDVAHTLSSSDFRGLNRNQNQNAVIDTVTNPKLNNYRPSEISVAITATSYKEPPVVNSIRRLTPKECERLQGFPDNWTEGESDTQRYKMCGNAVTTNVVQAVMEKLL